MLNDDGYFSFNRQNYSYLTRGIYVDQLRNWTGLFPKDRLLVLSSERLFEDPSGSFKRVHQFLGLPGWEANGYEERHDGTYSQMDAETRERLVEYFRPHNRRLYDFLGVDLDWDR